MSSVVTKQVGFVVHVDTEAIAPMSVEVFLYRMFNDINNEHKITEITVDGVTVDTTPDDALYNLPLGEDLPLA